MAYTKMIGAEVKRKEDPRLITGRGTYVPNVNLPNMHYVGFVRSPFAHANIMSIDTSAAKAVPGVVAVLTGDDLQPHYEMMLQGAEKDGVRPRAHYPLSIGRVRHIGEAIVAVVASSAQAAADGVAAVEVAYDPLPAVADMMAALQPDAPQIHADAPGNVEHVMGRSAGDVDTAFANAHKIVKERLVNQRLLGMPMETRATVAVPDPWTGGLTVYTSTQAPHFMRRDLAKTLRLDENSVRVIAPDVGGGFGLKVGMFPEDAVLSALALKFNLPMKWVEERIEHATATTHGRAQITDIEAAVDANGKVHGLKMQVYADIGAYPIATDVPDLTILMAVGTYDIQNLKAEVKTIFTNTTSVAAYRGAGRPEAAYMIERAMDLLADELGMDPAELRRRNFIAADNFPYKAPMGANYDSGDYATNLDALLTKADYAALRTEQAKQRAAGGKLVGIGLATYVEICGFDPSESAVVTVDEKAKVTVLSGTSPHGQGHKTAWAQIVADSLQIPPEDITVIHNDTALVPKGHGTYGSRSAAMGGSAVWKNSETVRERAKQVAAHLLEAAVADVTLTDGRFHVVGTPAVSVGWQEVAAASYASGADPANELKSGEDFASADQNYPFGAHLAVVEIDPATGAITIARYITMDDCGKVINPLLVEGQVHGGIAQGVGQALLENAVYDENGTLLSGSLMDYNLPRADNFPLFETNRTETPSPLNPLGVKGIGEAATIGSTPTIVNAVVDALSHLGVRHLDMPLTAEKIWRTIHHAAV